jgi:hypothetical protein
MFVALQRWVAVGILGGAFVAGALGGYVLRATTARHPSGPEAASVRGAAPAPVALAAPAAPAAPAVVPQAQPPIVVRVIAEAARPAPAPAPRPAPTPAAARHATATERPASLGVPEVKPVPTPGHFYKVQAGDTLHEVAVRAYGGIRRLGDLIHANPALDPNRIRIGAMVYVPAGAEAPPAGPGEAPRAAPATSPPAAPAAPAVPAAAPPAPAETPTAAPAPRRPPAEESPRKCG